jgi:hypothetical protein
VNHSASTAPLLLTLIAFGSASRAQDSTTDAQLKAAIDTVQSPQGVYVFFRSPARAAELLVAALKPARPGTYHDGGLGEAAVPQAVWEIRALRALTALDFKAPTRARLDDQEAHFLGLDSLRRIRFFGEWMSRALVWVAPRDAQEEIIRMWRQWVRANARTYRFVNDSTWDRWYW